MEDNFYAVPRNKYTWEKIQRFNMLVAFLGCICVVGYSVFAISCTKEQKAVVKTVVDVAHDTCTVIPYVINGNTTVNTICVTVDELTPFVQDILSKRAKAAAAASAGVKPAPVGSK